MTRPVGRTCDLPISPCKCGIHVVPCASALAQLESTRVSYKLLSISLRYAVNFPFPFPHDHGDKEKCAGMFMVWMELAGKIPLPGPSRRHDEMRVKMDGLPSAAAVPPFLTFFGNCAAITKVVKTRDRRLIAVHRQTRQPSIGSVARFCPSERLRFENSMALYNVATLDWSRALFTTLIKAHLLSC